MEPDRPPRVMPDANILVALFVRKGDHALARLAGEGRIRTVLCGYMVEEARRMLRRAFPRRIQELEPLLEALAAERVPAPSEETLARYPPLVRDPADHPVLVAALESGVEYLVTSDRAVREDAARSLPAAGETLRVVSVPELEDAVRNGRGDFRAP
jgi:predicted nucleic acid-binding protein